MPVFHRILRFLNIGAVVALWWLGYAFDFPDDDDSSRLTLALVEMTRDNASSWLWWAAGIGATSWVLSLVTAPPTKSEQQIDNILTAELNAFRETAFSSVPPNEPLDNNRITLFRHKDACIFLWPMRGLIWPWGMDDIWPWRWRSPWAGWLVIAHRSGHAAQSRSTRFLASPTDGKAEGVAGETWRRASAYRVTALPDLSGVQYHNSPKRLVLALLTKIGRLQGLSTRFQADRQEVRIYAQRTNVNERAVWQRIKYNKKCPREIVGVPIETANGKRWGVLILDSCNQHVCIDTDDRRFRSVMKRFGELLLKLHINV